MGGERVITVTIESNNKSVAPTRNDRDLCLDINTDFSITKDADLQISASFTRERKTAKVPARRPKPAPKQLKSPILVSELTQIEERIDEEDLLKSSSRSLGPVSFQANSSFSASKSLRDSLELTKVSFDQSQFSQNPVGKPKPALKVSKPYEITETDFAMSQNSHNDSINNGRNEFMPLIYRKSSVRTLGKRPEFSTSIEPPDSPRIKRPDIVIPSVNDDTLAVQEATVAEERTDETINLSPIQKRREENTISELVSTSKKEPRSVWMFVGVEKAKEKESEPEIVANMNKITKIARKGVKTTEEFRKLSIAMSKWKFEHFIAVMEGKSVKGIYKLSQDMLTMERVWGSGPEAIISSRASCCYRFDMSKMGLCPCNEQKMSQEVDAISL